MVVERTWILLLVPLALLTFFLWRGRSFYVFPSLDPVPEPPVSRIFSIASKASSFLLVLLLLFLAAGVHISGREGLQYGYGADIIFLLDESRSMKDPFGPPPAAKGADSEDRISKFSAAKNAIQRFMETRKTAHDRYGLIAFGSSAVKVLPLSMNHELFLSCLHAQESMLSSTFLYFPLASGINELMQSRSRSRVLVLVSDGGGPLDDEKYGFSKTVMQQGIRFYWVSLGSDWLNELPNFLEKIGPLGKRMDISNLPELEKGFDEIHRMERSLIIYRSSSSKISSGPLVYSALLLMTLTWLSHSMFVYRRKGSAS
ncbi:MAG: VWA domain-containing protein [Desulfobacteraceae bacterium]|nr:MAG: VWA domain-containing protein [Desulfobacteraceae bacterium]